MAIGLGGLSAVIVGSLFSSATCTHTRLHSRVGPVVILLGVGSRSMCKRTDIQSAWDLLHDMGQGPAK